MTCFCSILKSSKLFITRRQNDVYRINFWGAEVVFNKINQPSDSHGIQRDTLHVFINIGQKRTKHNSLVDSFSFSHMTIYKVEWHNVHTKKTKWSKHHQMKQAHSRIERMNKKKEALDWNCSTQHLPRPIFNSSATVLDFIVVFSVTAAAWAIIIFVGGVVIVWIHL